MRIAAFSAALFGAGMIAGCTMSDRPSARADADSRGEAAVAQSLAGRTAGPPQSCINLATSRSNRSFTRDVILFGEGSRIYVNRPRGGCDALQEGRALITRTGTSQLCSGDIVQVTDLTSGVTYGSCSLGDFVPYLRRR